MRWEMGNAHSFLELIFAYFCAGNEYEFYVQKMPRDIQQ